MSSTPSKQSLPYVPFFFGDFLKSTAGWTLLERGAYMMLLFSQWELGSLPNDPARLASIIGIDSAQMADIWPLLSQKFPQNPDGRLVNPRMEEHRARVERYRESLSEAGKKGMKERWKEPEPPPGLDITAWERWKEYRRETGKPIKQASISAAHRELATFGAQQAAVVEHSIASGYQGLVAPKDTTHPSGGGSHLPFAKISGRSPPDAFDVARGRPKIVV